MICEAIEDSVGVYHQIEDEELTRYKAMKTTQLSTSQDKYSYTKSTHHKTRSPYTERKTFSIGRKDFRAVNKLGTSTRGDTTSRGS